MNHPSQLALVEQVGWWSGRDSNSRPPQCEPQPAVRRNCLEMMQLHVMQRLMTLIRILVFLVFLVLAAKIYHFFTT